MTGLCLHFGADHRKPGTAHLFHPHLNPHFEFDTEFDKTLKNQCFSPFQHHQKSSKTPSKIPSNPYKIRLQSNSSKIFKKFIQNVQNKTLPPTPFHPTKIKYFPQSDHLKITFSPNPLKFTSQTPKFSHSSHTQIEKYIT